MSVILTHMGRKKDGTRLPDKHLKPAVKFGGGCNGVGRLVFIDGT
jgi:hypothetical protein